MLWALLSILAGQLAIALGWAPVLIKAPEVSTGWPCWVRSVSCSPCSLSRRAPLRRSRRSVPRRRARRASVASPKRAGELASSLDYEVTLTNVARLAIPQLADWCFVYVLQDDGAIRRLAMEFANPSLKSLAGAREGDFTVNPEADQGVSQVIRTGRPVLHVVASASLLASDVYERDELAAMLEQFGITSWICVPLSVRGRTFGAISLVMAASGRHLR